MALQLSGAFKRDSLANLQVRLPALVIGGGLTGIDTTTEAAAYYPVQVEKFLERWEALAARGGGDAALASSTTPRRRRSRASSSSTAAPCAPSAQRAAAAGEAPDFAPLVAQWGGVSLVYRAAMDDSPAYRLNHEEITKFFEEGVRFVEKLSPLACVPDEHGALEAVEFERLVGRDAASSGPTGERVRCRRAACSWPPARRPTSPTSASGRARSRSIARAKAFKSFRAVRGADGELALEPVAPGEVGFFTSYLHDGHTVSYYGDNHPVYAGSVVRAMASAKDGAPHVEALFAHEIAALDAGRAARARRRLARASRRRLDDDWRATVVRVERLTPTIVEVVVRAPAAARHFEPGQFFRLQNYEALPRRHRPPAAAAVC